MRLNNGISKAVSLGLTILIALLALLLLVGVADTVKEVISVARGYYSSYCCRTCIGKRPYDRYKR